MERGWLDFNALGIRIEVHEMATVSNDRNGWFNLNGGNSKRPFGEAIELVVPPAANAARLLRFMCQLEERLSDNHASIEHAAGSWDCGAVITILGGPTTLVNLLERLENMPEVEKVEEEPTAKGASYSFPKKFGGLPRSSIRPSKRIRVTLKESSMARQGLATVLN